MIKKLLTQNPLFVFALEVEAAQLFADKDVLFTGVGKVNSSYHLTRRIAKMSPSIIVNLGSAGGIGFNKGNVVCCSQFIQRDMDTTELGTARYETPFSDVPALFEYGLNIAYIPSGVCGSGDNFEVNHTQSDYNVIDMEAYPLAYIAKSEDIPFLCLKYITDGADGGAASTWEKSVHLAAETLRKTIDDLSK